MSGIFQRTPPETGSLCVQTGSLRRRSASEPGWFFLCHRSGIETHRRHEAVLVGHNRTRSRLGILAEAEQSLLIRPSMGQSLCQAGDCHTRGSSAVGDRLNDFWRQERQDGQAPDMTFGETFARGDVIE